MIVSRILKFFQMAARNWHRDGLIVSTDRSLLQLATINAAFDSDLVWWAKAFPEDQLKTMLDSSLCFGLYSISAPGSDESCTFNPLQIGLARVITDFVSFAYLTDVYVLKEYQGKGLGGWMIQCIQEHVGSWPNLRALMLICSPSEAGLYQRKLGAEVLKSVNGHEVQVMVKNGLGR